MYNVKVKPGPLGFCFFSSGTPTASSFSKEELLLKLLDFILYIPVFSNFSSGSSLGIPRQK
jgi:hypothetical protein